MSTYLLVEDGILVLKNDTETIEQLDFVGDLILRHPKSRDFFIEEYQAGYLVSRFGLITNPEIFNTKDEAEFGLTCAVATLDLVEGKSLSSSFTKDNGEQIFILRSKLGHIYVYSKGSGRYGYTKDLNEAWTKTD